MKYTLKLLVTDEKWNYDTMTYKGSCTSIQYVSGHDEKHIWSNKSRARAIEFSNADQAQAVLDRYVRLYGPRNLITIEEVQS